MPTTQRRITPRQLELVLPYLDGKTKAESALTLGISPETVAGALTLIRAQLRAEGYLGTHTAIGLRKALRARGDIDNLDYI